MYAFEKELGELNGQSAERTGLKRTAIEYNKGGKLVDVYDYKDEQGEVVYQVRRYEDKKFAVFTRKDGEWIPGLEEALRVPYHLPELSKANKIYICEGEKDADNVAELGFTTTTFFGAHWLEQYKRYFVGAFVRILPDNDDVGRKLTISVAASLWATIVSIKIILLPGLQEKEDVTDWIQRGGDRKEMMKLVKSTPEWTPHVLNDVVRDLNEKHAAITVSGTFRVNLPRQEPGAS